LLKQEDGSRMGVPGLAARPLKLLQALSST
jgi:hypothetical protein